MAKDLTYTFKVVSCEKEEYALKKLILKKGLKSCQNKFQNFILWAIDEIFLFSFFKLLAGQDTSNNSNKTPSQNIKAMMNNVID